MNTPEPTRPSSPFDTAPDLYHQLSALLNAHSMENGSDTPDFVLADYMLDCLSAFERAVAARELHARGSS